MSDKVFGEFGVIKSVNNTFLVCFIDDDGTIQTNIAELEDKAVAEEMSKRLNKIEDELLGNPTDE